VPVYVHRCRGCGQVFDVLSSIEKRNAIQRCSICDAVSDRIVAVPISHTEFRAGLYPCGPGDSKVYIGDRRQLRNVCQSQGLISHYLEGSPSTGKKPELKPTKYTEQDDKDISELYDATIGKGSQAIDNAAKWVKEKQSNGTESNN